MQLTSCLDCLVKLINARTLRELLLSKIPIHNLRSILARFCIVIVHIEVI